MSLWDDALDTVKKTARQVGNAAGDVFESSKKHLKAADIRSDIKDRYLTIGKLCYDEILNGVSHSTEINAVAEEITALNEKLAAVNEEIRNAKNIVLCPACGARVAKGSSFCPSCGQRFADSAE